jgi:hypothetical protein
LKNIECDVFSTPILESRTRKGIMRVILLPLRLLLVPGDKKRRRVPSRRSTLCRPSWLMETVIPPMNSKGIQKLKAKPTVLGLGVKAPMATVTVARKQVAGEDLQN